MAYYCERLFRCYQLYHGLEEVVFIAKLPELLEVPVFILATLEFLFYHCNSVTCGFTIVSPVVILILRCEEY